MKVPQAVKTKCVMGELTLGDVLNLITSRFSYVCVVQDGHDMGRYDNWCVNEKGKLVLYRDENAQDYDHDFSFDLKNKVNVKNDRLEFDRVFDYPEGERHAVCLHFLETKVLELGCLLP